MLGLPAPFVPHSASLSPATATRVLSTPVPVFAPPTSLDECLFSISLVSVPPAVRLSVSSGCARRRSVSTYAAIFRKSKVFRMRWSYDAAKDRSWPARGSGSPHAGLCRIRCAAAQQTQGKGHVCCLRPPPLFFLNPRLRICLLILERGRGRNIGVRETLNCCLQYVPQLGIELTP